MAYAIILRARIDERKVKQKYLQSVDGYKFHWTANIEKAMKFVYSKESVAYGEISDVEDALNEEYYKTYGIYISVQDD
mgnify:CR=1